MTTRADISRVIAAVQKAGLYVVAIRPDGTVLVGTEPPRPEQLLGTEAKSDDCWTTFQA